MITADVDNIFDPPIARVARPGHNPLDRAVLSSYRHRVVVSIAHIETVNRDVAGVTIQRASLVLPVNFHTAIVACPDSDRSAGSTTLRAELEHVVVALILSICKQSTFPVRGPLYQAENVQGCASVHVLPLPWGEA